jgi:4-hydroxybenzoate adenylyltransferase
VHENMTHRWSLHAREQGWQERTAFHADGRAWTFAEIFEGAARTATGYRSRGLRPGDRVVLALPDSVELVWCLLGAWQAGLVAIPVNVQMSRDDLSRDVRTAEPALVVADPETVGWLLPDAVEAGVLSEAEPSGEFAVGGDAPALAMFTSGTTGAPKLCFFRHRDLGTLNLGALPVGPDSVGLSLSRMYFVGGLGASVLTTLSTGQSAVLSRSRATAADAVRLAGEHHVSVLLAQPSFLARMLLEPGGAEALGAVRLVLCAGEVLTARLRERLVPILGNRLMNAYGATEIGGIAFGSPAAYESPSAVGSPLPGKPVRVLDGEGGEVARGDRGELNVLVPFATRGVARGGLGPDVVTDVWWQTGDLASVDDDGVVHVHGRLDDVEVVGGQNVVPGEVERLLESHPQVLEAAVSSMRRPAGDTTLRAYVVTTAEQSEKDELGGELIELARSGLSWYKVPQDVLWLEALPRNANGKLLRRVLRARGDQFA